MRDEARRSELMMRGKMVALAVMMYVQDHEFGLPPTDQVPGAILPYLKDASAAEGFVYEIGGGKLADHAAPATTVMGYLSGPGGRAVVYLDGHVEWRADGS
jgi:prepilin-type processing-associated H-X9-DG protein